MTKYKSERPPGSGWPRETVQAGPGAAASGHTAATPNAGHESHESHESLRDQLNDVATEAREETVRLAHDARAEAQGVVHRRKNKVAGRLGSFAAALRDAGHQLEADGGEGIADYADRAAQEVDRAAIYLRESDVGEVVGDVEDLARRRPALFLGGTLLAGFFLARFLKSSGERGRRRPRPAPDWQATSVDGLGDAAAPGGPGLGRVGGLAGRKSIRGAHLVFRRSRLGELLEDRPLAAAGAVLAAGVLVGIALPATRREDEWLGDRRDDLLESAREAGRDVLETGRQAALDAVERVKESVREQELTPEQLAGKARHVVRDAAGSVREAQQDLAQSLAGDRP
jgi:hypothetical protein